MPTRRQTAKPTWKIHGDTPPDMRSRLIRAFARFYFVENKDGRSETRPEKRRGPANRSPARW